MNDDLEQLLHLPALEPAAPERQEALLAVTHRQLQRTRRTRQVLRMGLVAMVFVGGLGLGSLLFKPMPEGARLLPTQSVPAPATPLLTAAQLELEAEKADQAPRSAQLYRQAGDRFLEAQDIQSALRCYRLHLTEGGQAARPVFTSDSWLLMSLKTNRNEGDQ